MKKIIFYLLMSLVLFSCDKKEEDPHVFYDDIFEVSFTMDGKTYSKKYPQHQLHPVTGASFIITPLLENISHGPIYEGDGWQLMIVLGYYLTNRSDTTANLKELQTLMTPGAKDYKCLSCFDTTIKNAVEITYVADPMASSNYWFNTKIEDNKPVPITNEQDGSSFVITSISPSTTNGANRNAFIAKGTFHCNIYNSQTNEKKVLTDGKFTFLLGAFEGNPETP